MLHSSENTCISNTFQLCREVSEYVEFNYPHDTTYVISAPDTKKWQSSDWIISSLTA